MTALGLAMTALYFGAVGAAFLNEKRRARVAARAGWAALDDDEASPLDATPGGVDAPEPVEAAAPVDGPVPVTGPDKVERRPLDRRYDDET
jgi:sec-independent protein translocase protein TatC